MLVRSLNSRDSLKSIHSLLKILIRKKGVVLEVFINCLSADSIHASKINKLVLDFIELYVFRIARTAVYKQLHILLNLLSVVFVDFEVN